MLYISVTAHKFLLADRYLGNLAASVAEKAARLGRCVFGAVWFHCTIYIYIYIYVYIAFISIYIYCSALKEAEHSAYTPEWTVHLDLAFGSEIF